MISPPAALPSVPSATGARHQDDLDLVARSGRGDASAFEAIMRRYNRLLFRTARGVVSDDAEAQDVVQETYLHAFSHLQAYRGEAALGTWLTRMAINAAIDSQRKKGRVVRLDDSQDVSAEPTSEHMMSFSAPAQQSPDHVAERSQLRDLLQSAIGRLPPIYRSVFMLRAVQEMSVDETAHCLGVSDAVVKTRYLRARSMLRDTLGAQVESHMQEVYAFAGPRCDAVVAHVLAELQRRGQIGLG